MKLRRTTRVQDIVEDLPAAEPGPMVNQTLADAVEALEAALQRAQALFEQPKFSDAEHRNRPMN